MSEDRGDRVIIRIKDSSREEGEVYVSLMVGKEEWVENFSIILSES